MIRKFHKARREGDGRTETGGWKKDGEGKIRVELWGDGTPMREFMHAHDLADAVVYLMKNKNASDLGEFVNVGTGRDGSIKELAGMIAEVVGYKGDVNWDTSKPNGTPRKLLDVTRLSSLGWKSRIPLEEGIRMVYKWYCENLYIKN